MRAYPFLCSLLIFTALSCKSNSDGTTDNQPGNPGGGGGDTPAGPVGSLDSTFNSTSGADGGVAAIAVQSSGKILIGGAFNNYGGTSKPYLARLNSDGSLDTGFNSGTGPNAAINTIVIDSSGKIMIGGNFTSYAGTARQYIARLNSDGTLDTSFNSTTGVDSSVTALGIDSSGKVLIAGAFMNYASTGRQRIARLNSDGSLDTGFNSASGFNNMTVIMGVDSSDKPITAGNVTNYAGTAMGYLARINGNGTLDTGFLYSGGPNNTIAAIKIHSDGKIYIGGSFTAHGATTRQRIARLNSDGTLDTSFNSASGAANGSFGDVRAVAVDSSGRVVIGGDFITYAGTTRQYVARVSTTGTLDTGFNSTNGANSYISAIAIDSSGKILIGGNFTSYAGTTRQRIARIE